MFRAALQVAGSVGAETGRVLRLRYRRPDIVAPARLRSDACVELRTGAPAPPGIAIGLVGAGRYAVCRHHGPREGTAGVYWRLFTR